MQLSFWESFLESKKGLKIKNRIFYSILRSAVPVEMHENEIVMDCDSDGAKKYLESKKSELEEMISLHISKKTRKKTPLRRFSAVARGVFPRARLGRPLSFGKFSVFLTNQVAFAASQ